MDRACNTRFHCQDSDGEYDKKQNKMEDNNLTNES